MNRRDGLGAILTGVSILVVAGCQQWMTTQPKRQTLSTAPFFSNDSEARPLPPGTFPVGAVRAGDPYYTGMASGSPVATIPVPITLELLVRGQQRYDIYCAPCHGLAGAGDGMIVQRGFPGPPSYHSARLLAAPAGHLFLVMTDGWGAMYPYADRVDTADRWAIAGYIRALQLSWHTPAAALPPAVRSDLQPQPGSASPATPRRP